MYAHFGYLGFSQEITFPEESSGQPRKEGCGSTGHVAILLTQTHEKYAINEEMAFHYTEVLVNPCCSHS